MNYNYPYLNNQNYGMYPQTYQQQIMQQTTSQPFNEVKFASETEANSYMPNANQRILFFDTENNVFRIKSTDSFGKSTLETFKFEKVENSQINKVEYVTKEDLEVVTNQIKDLYNKIGVKDEQQN